MIAVTGSSGWIGREACIWLKSQGLEVRKLERKPAGRDAVYFDLCDANWKLHWPRVLAGCTSLLHCAAHVHRPNETSCERAAFADINIRGTERLLQVCQAVGVARIAFASTAAVYDWSCSEKPRVEQDALALGTAYARSKFEAEEFVRQFRGDWRIARLATVFGRGDSANFARLARALSRGRFFLPGRGDARKSVIEVTRAGELLGRLVVLTGAHGTTVNLAAPEAPSLREICDAFSRVFGYPIPRQVPLVLMRALARVGQTLTNIGIRPSLTISTLSKLTTSTVLDVARMQQLFPEVRWVSFADTLAAVGGYSSDGYVRAGAIASDTRRTISGRPSI